MRTYALLAARGQAEPRLVQRLRVLKLDEWGGLAMEDPASGESWLREALIKPLGLAARFTGFNSRPANPEAECERIRCWLEQNGPIDTCVLGIGLNGHLGFNEPAAALQPHAHVAKLSETSLHHSMVANQKARPTFGLTLGMADLLQAQQVLLLVSGAAKHPTPDDSISACFLELSPQPPVTQVIGRWLLALCWNKINKNFRLSFEIKLEDLPV